MIPTSPTQVRQWYASELGRKQFRYFMVSVVSVAISQAVLFIAYGPLNLGSAIECNLLATAVASGPSYYLNRAWAWGKTGRSHVVKEVIPFWTLAFVGLAISLWSVSVAESRSQAAHLGHIETSLIVNFASLAAYGVVWIAKFIIFEKYVFIDHSGSSEEPESPDEGEKVAATADT